MTMKTRTIAALPLTLAALLMVGCSGGDQTADNAQNAVTVENGAASEKGGHAEEEGEIDLSADQIRKAGIELVSVIRSGGGALTLPRRSKAIRKGCRSFRLRLAAVWCRSPATSASRSGADRHSPS